MNLTISGHHLEVTPAIREYVQSKLERIKRHFDQVIDIAVILTVDNLTEKEKRQKAEINLRLSGKTVYVESLSHDLYAAIDCLVVVVLNLVFVLHDLTVQFVNQAINRRVQVVRQALHVHRLAG
jgi:putative sigma-54 modulation protein